MNCPECNHASSRVLETIRVREGLRRRRICTECAHRFDTLERVELWDSTLQNYVAVAAEPPAPALAVVPRTKPAYDRQLREKAKAAAKYQASPSEDRLAGICLEAQSLLVQWWNESRWSKHKGRATWTEAAWEASVRRVAALAAPQQVALCTAGVEHGWQALKPEYLAGNGGRAQPAPNATGRPMPKDPAMLAALEQWPSQTA